MKTGLLISIRNKSKRFPGKVLKEFHGQTVTEHLIDRMKTAKLVDAVIIATSPDPRDAVFDGMARKKGIGVFKGSKEDKLKRYLDCASAFGLDAVIIVDGDDVLCFPEFAEKTAARLREGGCEVVFTKDLPLGAASSGLTKEALEKVMEMKDEQDTEVWGGYFTTGAFKVCYIEPAEEIFRHPEIRMTLDYEEDYEFFKAVFDELYPETPAFTSRGLMELLTRGKPGLNRLTVEAQKKYEANIVKATPVKFKRTKK